MFSNQTQARPTAFDELRFGYFDTAFGNMLKGIRGGTNPIGTMQLAVCAVSTLSEIEWSIDNASWLTVDGELKPMTHKEKDATGCRDKPMFEGWLDRWVRDSGINAKCDSPKVYGVRCGLIHTAGWSETLNKSGVKAWNLTVNYSADHYAVVQQDVPRVSLEMPDFAAEIMLGADAFFNDKKNVLETASAGLRRHIGFIAGLTRLDSSGIINGRLVRNIASLAWFDESLSRTPLQISKDELAGKIRDYYNQRKHLVLE